MYALKNRKTECCFNVFFCEDVRMFSCVQRQLQVSYLCSDFPEKCRLFWKQYLISVVKKWECNSEASETCSVISKTWVADSSWFYSGTSQHMEPGILKEIS